MSTERSSWTVLTWNLQGSKSTDLGRVADVIRAESPDVVALQEVRRPQADALARSLTMNRCWAQKHNPYRPLLTKRTEGAAILAPHELRDADHTVISTAGSKRSYMRRIVLWATVTRGDHHAVRVFDAHLSPHDLSAERLAEATQISTIACRFGDDLPIIVAGDFNNHDQPDVIGALPGVELTAAPATNPSEAPKQHLDHVLVPSGSIAIDTAVPTGSDRWAALSDHLPLTVRFELSGHSGDGA